MANSTDQDEVFDFLANPATHHLVTEVKRFNTHGSYVFLAGDDAYKVKRAISYPYMDYSSIGKRRLACEKEIAVNKRHAPDIYVSAIPVTRDAAGLHLGGKGTIVEWVVHMKRFDENATFDRLADEGKLTGHIIDFLADAVAETHRHAPEDRDVSAVNVIKNVILESTEELGSAREIVSHRKVAVLRDAMLQAFEKSEALLRERCQIGKVRHCHGDLHLRNIVLHGGKPVLFDALEFDERLATIDILYDLAFLVMDLYRRNLQTQACRLLNRYLWVSDDEVGEIKGLALLPLFMALRATIRAKVMVSQAALAANPTSVREEINGYVQAATDLLSPSAPYLVAIGGLSGTGKTRLAEVLAPKFGAAPGALHLRSDIERKRRFGVSATDRLPEAAYSSAASESVYADISVLAAAGLKAGRSVIVDATFRSPRDRHELARIAAGAHAPFLGLWLEAPKEVRMARVRDRAGDASDATPEITRDQSTDDIGDMEWAKLDAATGPQAVCETALRLISARPAG
jgi:aminoglycoside phosphotransferase family enzyme/predicted kinase